MEANGSFGGGKEELSFRPELLLDFRRGEDAKAQTRLLLLHILLLLGGGRPHLTPISVAVVCLSYPHSGRPFDEVGNPSFFIPTPHNGGSPVLNPSPLVLRCPSLLSR